MILITRCPTASPRRLGASGADTLTTRKSQPALASPPIDKRCAQLFCCVEARPKAFFGGTGVRPAGAATCSEAPGAVGGSVGLLRCWGRSSSALSVSRVVRMKDASEARVSPPSASNGGFARRLWGIHYGISTG